MRAFFYVFVLLCLFGSTHSVFSQDKQVSKKENNNNDTQVKNTNDYFEQKFTVAKQLIEKDIKELTNPKYRVWAFANAGRLLYYRDKEKAENLFKSAKEELEIAIKQSRLTENKDEKVRPYAFYHRKLLIDTISELDKELAYKYLLETRPEEIQTLINKYYKTTYFLHEGKKDYRMLDWEIETEYGLKALILVRNPNRLEEFITSDLNTFSTHFTVDRLKKLLKKDPKLAHQLTEKVILQLLNVQVKHQGKNEPLVFGSRFTISTALKLLAFIDEQFLKKTTDTNISDELVKKLAEKTLNDLLATGMFLDFYFYYYQRDGLDVVKRYFPGQFQRIEKFRIDAPKLPKYQDSLRYQNITSKDFTSDTLLSNAPKFLEESKYKIYRLAACKLSDEQNFDQAEKMLESKYKSKALAEKQISLIIFTKAIKDISEKEFDKAEIKIKNISDDSLRIDALTHFAEEIYKQNPMQNKQKALSILNQAEIESEKINKYDLESLGEIAAAYAEIDKNLGFRKLDQIVKLVNLGLFDTQESLNWDGGKIIGYEPYMGSKLFNYFDESTVRLRKYDFVQTLNLINRIKNPVDRITMKLVFIQRETINRIYKENVKNYCNPKKIFI